MQAFELSDMRLIEAILSSKVVVAVDERTEEDYTFLHETISKLCDDSQDESRLLNIAELLLNRGGDVNAKNEWRGFTPLHLAARANHVGAVRLLLKYGADVNANDNSWTTALYTAAKYSNYEMVKALIEAGAAINNDDRSPLHCACANNDLAIIKILLQNGANVKVVDEKGRVPLELLLRSQNEENKPDTLAYMLSKRMDFIKIESDVLNFGLDSDTCEGYSNPARR